MPAFEPDSAVRVIPISNQRSAEAAEVLANAFLDYPVIRYFFEDQGSHYGACVSELYRFFVESCIAQGKHVMGVLSLGKLVAVSCVQGPEIQSGSEDLSHAEERFFNKIGATAVSRIQAYNKMVSDHLPQKPHYYLEDIGVLPEYRGMGFARILLQQVHDLSASNPISTGIGLDTHEFSNVSLYRHFGYQVTGETYLDHIRTWFMFRSDHTGEKEGE
jgi:ribosomal protein S18 acetylase RimI-like enzyme